MSWKRLRLVIILGLLVMLFVSPYVVSGAFTDQDRQLLQNIGSKGLEIWDKIKSTYKKTLELSERVEIYEIKGTEYQVGDNATIFLQLLNGTTTPVNDASCYLDIYYPDKTSYYSDTLMTYLNGSDGLYYFDIDNLPNVVGVYMISAYCIIPSDVWIDDFLDYSKLEAYENITISGGKVKLSEELIIPGIIPGIINGTIDTFEFDTAQGRGIDLINLTENIIIVVYSGSGADGFIKTFSILNNGTINSTIDSLEYELQQGMTPDIINVDNDVYAIVISGLGSDGFIDTVNITQEGNIIGMIDTFEFDPVFATNPSIVRVNDSIFAFAYQDNSDDGIIKTIEILPNGTINPVIDTFNFSVDAFWTYIINVNNDIYAVSFHDSNSDGFLSTINISSNGSINGIIQELEHDTNNGVNANPLRISDNLITLVYSNGSYGNGIVKTFNINNSGSIIQIDSFIYETDISNEPVIRSVADDVYVIIYSGSSTTREGYVETIQIFPNGTISTDIIDNLEYESGWAMESDILSLNGGIFVAGFTGDSEDGYISTLNISVTSVSDEVVNYIEGFIRSNPINLTGNLWNEYQADYDFNDGSIDFKVLNSSNDTICNGLGNISSCAGVISPIKLYANFTRPYPDNSSPELDKWWVTWGLIQYEEVRGSGEMHINPPIGIGNASFDELWCKVRNFLALLHSTEVTNRSCLDPSTLREDKRIEYEFEGDDTCPDCINMSKHQDIYCDWGCNNESNRAYCNPDPLWRNIILIVVIIVILCIVAGLLRLGGVF